ncbi:hypothetical protein FH972_025658 [Carpinus fangiana]|uniref:Zinc finger PHD-type domain-containing protein n=1 Tax=Carpinus fangiana TaxID=176857 RepID=A0A5N6L2M7_9ROSI|nr:hypothetical protein FH972_025658 [Carpinus fangiana]
MSPRRSSRARTAQPSTSALQDSNTASSNSSSRDRNGHSILLQDGRATTASPEPLSEVDSEQDGITEQNARSTRQTRRAQTGERDTEAVEEPGVEDDDGEEEEITRCVCRRLEYPGPPVPLKDVAGTSMDSLPEDAGGLFIQCDICKVWQHGGCVGIMDEAMCPDNYYCEQCRGDLHKVLTGAKGQRYSRYLPVVEPDQTKTHRRTSSAKRDTDVRSLRETETKPTSLRQQQMNSRHQRITNNSRAAYEEEQMLLQALEASKVNSGDNSSGTGQRNIKRGRDESEESSQDLKRRKTGSRSGSPVRREQDIDEDDSENDRSHNGGSKKARGAAAQAQREREARDQEKERERVRAEAAGRRKGRAERRHADESEPPEDISKTIPPPNKKDAKFNKSTTNRITQSNAAAPMKKTMRPKRGRIGRNQYTRDREDDNRDSPPTSRDSDGAGPNGDGAMVLLPNGSKPARPRYINPNRTSMNELRKRAAGILEFISRTQVEIAGEITPSAGHTTPTVAGETPRPGNEKGVPGTGASKLSNEIGEDASVEHDIVEDESTGRDTGVDESIFKEMSSVQMMDVLTRQIVLWQKLHGKYGERT